ncbi:MAG: nuclear transport factor 2 family protein [Rubrobacter sp.]|nr:nuclear transport factor 2 family protein [Rubrobacter sp.]
MIGEETTGRLDFDALRDAIERCEADALIGFYAEDAELRILNGEVLESPAFELRGKAEIERYLRAVCDQEMTCIIEGEVVFADESITFDEMCAYPDGTQISVETTLEIGEGKVQRQTDVARSARHDDRSER